MSVNIFQKYFDAFGSNENNTIGVFDELGYIVASNAKKLLGKKIKTSGIKYTAFSIAGEPKFTLFIDGPEDDAAKIALPVSAALDTLKEFERENEDKEYLFKQIVNGGGEDTLYRCQSLGIEDEVVRVVFVINVSSKNISLAKQIVEEAAPVRENDCVYIGARNELVFIRKCKTEPSNAKLLSVATQISAALVDEIVEQPSIGIGKAVTNLSELPKSYKTAVSALEIGYVFENKNKIYSYMNLGISRLITSVPIEKCKAFLNEILKEDVLREIDADTMSTVQRFFDYDLNISLAARELYIHRNTLVYRLNNIQKLTGLDVRKFDDALLFKVAMLIQRYLRTGRR